MPWQGRRVIDVVLDAWSSACIDTVLFVVRQDDHGLIAACQDSEIDILTLAAPTPDMKTTVARGLKQMAQQYSPSDQDQVLIAPADLPRITSDLINRVATAEDYDKIVVPYFGGKRGHPIRIPWFLTGEVAALAADQGLDWLIQANPVHRIELKPESRPRDIDTPEDYEREVNIAGR